MSFTQLQHSPSSILHIKFNPKKSTSTNLNFTLNSPFKSSISLNCSSNDSLSSSISSLQSIKPYVQSEWKLILQGWTCSAISVFSLSKIVPNAGKFSMNLGDFHAIKCDGAKLAAFFVVRLIANYLQQAFLWEAAFNSAYKIRADVFEKVLERDLGFFEGGDHHGVYSSPGDISHRITSEASDVADTVFALLNTIVPSTLQLSAMAAQMLVISPVLSTISALVVPLVALVIALLGSRLQRISRKAHLSIAALSTYLNEGVGKAYNELKQGEPAIERLFDLTRFKPQVIERSDAIHIDSIRGEVKFCDISFQYRDGLPLVLNGVDLHIKAGEIVALVGPSGGGKTTLAKLLLRLYDPMNGRILIDGHDVQSFRLESLRSHVALVSQDIMLFSGTVAENIGYKDLVRGIDLEKVKLAAKTANADEFVSLLPRGYETHIGSRGSILSGGQKQRLAIARAIYQNSSILVMDEATSALDSRSELLVRQAVERVMKNHTVLVIAHRLETVLMAERILVLEAGRLQEVDRSIITNNLHDLQSSASLVI
ncbi:ABC transporter B family member 29, chloroplastic isoform X3 [Beta vulgaris subsp. vulgaris]|uniref:ABC transporter B family member 29, chloroplastic isoform X3 n=1 Tax=Beta vulgaris subsp. vulgaris TaxID=3555 RepID=UPI002036F989|nr:ABC transporter B family member 29, chloroplastic isoform X3 [Beta vulgaris subsp. vulgaris]